MSNVAKTSLVSGTLTIAGANTEEPLIATEIVTTDLYIQKSASAAGVVVMGDVNGQTLELTTQPVKFSDFFKNGQERPMYLNEIYVKSSSASDVVNFLYTVLS